MLDFSLEFIEGEYYLVPFGQAVSCGGRSIRLNPTGAVMWKKLREAVAAGEGGRSQGAAALTAGENDKTQRATALTVGENDKTQGAAALTANECDVIAQVLTPEVRSAWLNALFEEFEADNDEDRRIIETDAAQFFEMLRSHHIFEAVRFNSTLNRDSLTRHFTIAGLHMVYTGASQMYPKEFDDFLDEAADAVSDRDDNSDQNHSSSKNNSSDKDDSSDKNDNSDQNHSSSKNNSSDGDFTVKLDVSGILSRNYELGKPVVKTRDVSLFQVSDGYFMMFDSFSVIKECEIHTDGRVNLFYHIPSIKESGKCINRILADIDYERGRYEVFHAVRFAYLLFNKKRGVYALHSASFLYRDRLWLVSAPSGTGKSTHASIWDRVFGTPVINGDLNCIDVSGERLTVRGTPWCGTSGIFDTGDYPLGGVILLSRSKENAVLPTFEAGNATLSVANRLISPAWDDRMLKENIAAASAICRDSLVFTLGCDMSDDAAVVCKKYIDTKLDLD